MRLWIVLLIGAAFYFLLNLFFRKNWYKGLTVSIDFEKKEVREGDKNTLTEVVRNDKAMPLPVALVKFSITSRAVQFVGNSKSPLSTTEMSISRYGPIRSSRENTDLPHPDEGSTA